ncbi:type VI secretion system tip protein VgrG [uncultured Roseobacter sp.]|uniref:type VI secretion system tip protein VgrG n=1 Tax=uncultured Roseobacter sp. TaxID=114847 RepID=UPI00262C5D18|nr:type VI secretion system tip protein VgrG [uncultured Roseobacter sp.]
MADSPLDNADGPISVTIKVAGSAIDDALQILRVQVDSAVGQIPEAQVVLQAGSIAENEFPEADGNDFKIGSEISVAAAYGSGSDQELFKGLIVSKRMRVTRGAPRLELGCIDKAAKLTYMRKSALYEAKKDSDVMSQIISDAGLSADVSSTTDTERDILRYACSDWGYLRSLSDRAGHVITITGGKVTSKPPATSEAAVLVVTLGVDIISFDARVDAEMSLKGAKASAWDSRTQEVVEGTGKTPAAPEWGNYTPSALAEVLGDREFRVSTAREVPSADLTIATNARTLRTALASIQGECTFQGSGKAVPGVVIELAGLGDRFSGDAYVSGVRQLIEEGAWTTEVALGLPDSWNVDSGTFASESAAGLAAPIHGLQVGTVLQINEDPDSKARFKISLPMVADPAPQVWARYAQPYATSSAGFEFYPEVSDEVLVGFLNADPNAPVVLGSVHNSKAARPDEPTADNFIKQIVTKEKMKLIFDDEKKIITVETPGGHSVVMDDDATSITLTDSTGNKIEMASGGISMTSPGDITLSADGAISISATTDATLTGMNVTAEADTAFTGKGGATAEVSASGQTTVKGGIVMIN